jgi:hypothetical protein
MDLPTSLGALRRLSIDVANLTTQLAITQSSVEVVQQTAQTLMPDTWSKQMLSEDGEERQVMQITITGEQAENLMRLLSTIEALG